MFLEFENAYTYLVRSRGLVMLDVDLDFRMLRGLVVLFKAYCLASYFFVRRLLTDLMGLGAFLFSDGTTFIFPESFKA